MLIFCIVAAFAGLVIYNRYQKLKKEDHLYARQLLETTKSRLEFALSEAQLSAHSLATLIYNDRVAGDFDSMAKVLLAVNHVIDAAELIPDGVISYIYPLPGNESAIGYNVFNDTLQRKGLDKSIKERQFYFAGPLRLRSGEKGIVGVMPVFIKQKFWGFSAVVINLQTLFEKVGIDTSGKANFFFQLAKSGGEPGSGEEFLPNRHLKGSMSTTVRVPGATWKLSIVAATASSPLLKLMPFLLLAFFVSFITGWLAYIITAIPAKLSKLVSEKSAQLEEASKRNTAIVNAIPDIIFVLDQEGRFIGYNNPHGNPTLLTPENFMGKKVTEVMPPGLGPQLLENIKEAFCSKEIIVRPYQLEFEGELRYFEATYSMSGDSEVLVIIREITDRIESEMALKKSEDALRQMFIGSVETFYVVNKDYQITLINKVAESNLEKAWGHPINVGTKILNYLPKEKNEPVRESFQKAFNGEKVEYELPVCIPGLPEWVLVTYTPIKNKSGEITSVAIFTKDISLRKKAEQELKHAYHRLELISHTTNDAVWEWNIETGQLWGNEAHQYLYGLSVNDNTPTADMWVERIHPDDRERVVTKQEKILLSNQKVIISEYRFFTDTKGYVDIYDRCYIVRDQTGKAILMTGSMMDISERKKAEQELKLSEEKYRTLVEQAGDGIVLYDAEGKILDVNTGAIEAVGYTKAEISTMAITDILVPEEVIKNPLRIDELKNGKSTVTQRKLRCKDGNIIEAEVRSQQLPGGRFLSVIRDMTERIRTQEELKHSYRAIRELTAYLQNIREKERTNIAREIHDELGQQLTVLKMDVSWINKKIGDTADAAVKLKIQELLAMLDDTVKSVRRISSELRPSLLDDLGLVAAMEWQLAEFEKRSGINTSLIVPEKDLRLSNFAKTALFRIFQESLTNVARHSGATNLSVKLEKNNNSFVLSIVDNGKGFDKDNVVQKKTLGILGMTERSNMIGGSYKITSMPGKGTSISVSVPVEGNQ